MRIVALLFVFLCSLPVLWADGTKQVSPTNSIDGAALFIDPAAGNGNYFNAPASQRLQFTILNSATENVYFGLHTRTFSNGNTTLVTNAYYRILNAVGTVVAGPTAVPTAGAGFIADWTQANAGPNIAGGAPTGYTPLMFDPTANGDYYVEIYQSNDGGATAVTAQMTVPLFDFTVSTAANLQSPGRVWNRKWSFVTCEVNNANFPCPITSSFTGDYYGYTPDGFTLQVKFETGFRPLGYQLAMNFTGPNNTGNFTADRQSVNTNVTVPALNNGYQVFLTMPDATVFTAGTPGSPAFTSSIYGCPGAYFIPYVLDQPGDVSVLIDLNGTSGYQAGTSDLFLEAYGQTAGNQIMAWNGLDGLGAVVPVNFSAIVTVTLYQGRTNVPMNDAELNTNGLSVISVFPNPGTNRRLYWDDSNLPAFGTCGAATNNVTTGGVANVVLVQGTTGPTHAWDGNNPTTAVPAANGGVGSSTAALCDDYGNNRCLNTWFYAADFASPATTMVLPGCDLDGDGISNNSDLDDDNDGIPDLTECSSDPLLDHDSDGIPNYLDPQFAGFVDANSDGVNDTFDFDRDGTINTFDLDSDGDGITDLHEVGQPDTNNNGQIDGFADLNGNGLADAVDPACTSTPVTGQASANAGTNGTNNNIGNITDANAATFGALTGNPASIDLDFGVVLPAGTTITFSMSSAVAGAATGNFTRSLDDATYAQTQTYSVSTTTLQNVTYVLGAAARYVRVTTSSGNDTRIAIATYSYLNCGGVVGTAITPVNTDGTGGANYLDIDSDNDGIVDVVEAQTTSGYIAPTGSDTDHDGIDNAYDVTAGFGGAGLTPVNTDGTDNPDYTDLNSDNDLFSDAIEGWDTDGNGVANTTPTGVDSDNDGLDNAYDLNNAAINPTNGTTPASYPNLNNSATPERDWRETYVPPTVTLTGTASIAENAPGVVTLTATLSSATTAATTVTLTYTGTAANGTDYVASSTTITIPAGSTTGTVTIDPTDDLIFEGNETVIADITGVTGGNGATENGVQTTTVTITDNETAPTVTLTGTASIAENAPGVVTLTATLSAATTTATTVTLTYTGTATNGTDYVASSTTITIPAGATTGTVTIDPTDDLIFEGTETVIADITGVTGGNGATENGVQTATVTITDNETSPTVTLSGTAAIAENSGAAVTLTATLSVATTVATTVTLTYTGTAVSGTDYTASTTTITIPAGSLTGTVTVTPIDDILFEGSETVIADITGVTGGNGATENGTQVATVTITDNETAPTVTLSGTTSIAENAPGVVTLTATLSVATTAATTVTLTYTGTATNGTDYVASSTTITIPAGATTGTVTIDPTDDLIFEGNETVIVDITGVTGGNGATENGTQTATVTISDNETAPTVTLTGAASIVENAPGVVTLTATLSNATTVATVVTLTYTGTATNGTDYVASSTTITIPAGSTTGTVTIDPTDDALFEGSETVIADITNVTGGNGATESGTQTATVTITDDETAPTVTLTGTTSIAENAPGVVTLTATLSAATTVATTVTLTYTGTATSGTDYVASSTTITIPAGSLTGTVTIDPTDDAIAEGSETVIANITNVAGGNGATENGTQVATVTITDDEAAPTVTLTGTASIAENAPGVVTLTATLSGAAATATTVTLTYTGTATNGTDYVASSTTITIPAGSTTGTVTIDPTDDLIFEGNETAIADITNVTGGNGATESGTQTATVTIVDNETAPTVTLTGTTSVAENSGTAVTLTATLSVATTTATTITLTYTGTATGGTDYTASSTTITIPAGSLTGTVTVNPIDDALFEGAETVIADITNVTGGNGATENGTQTATVTITDNETAPTVTLTGTTSVAENAGTAVTLTATLSVATTTATTITLTYTGTATGGTDYNASSTTITIPAGSVTGSVTITPVDDAVYEGNETVLADITNVTGGNGAAESGVQTATVTIVDNETPLTVSLSGTTTILENGGGSATITATLSGTASTPTIVTVTYTGTATSGSDYMASSTTITIPAGSLTGTVTVTPIADALFEGSETVIIDITSVTGGNGAIENGTQVATVTIQDPGTAPTVTLTGTTTVAENSGTAVTLTATLSAATTVATTVTLTYTGTAASGTDYNASSTTITIPAGSLTGSVTITPIDDAIFEGTETVIADITSVTGGNGATESGTQVATVTITDNETVPTVTLSGTVSIAENAPGVVTLTATLSTAASTATTVTLTYTGTATNGTDYVASSTTITIPAGLTTGTVSIDPTDDLIFEGNETVIADITNVTGGNGATENGTQVATVTITDNETTPTVTLTGTATVAENSGTAVTLTATLSVATTTATTITLTYTGTATSGTDYNASPTTITIPAGSLSGTVTVTPIDDAVFEGNETVIADITNVTGGNGATENGTQTATVTIADNETVPTVTLTGTTSVAENSGTAVTLTATLSVAASTATTVTITYTGTATSGTDYNASSTTITIPAGSLTGTVTVTPIDDAVFEGNETVIADITNVTGGNGATENGTQTATVTIIDNETVPTVTLTGTTSVAENSGTSVTLTATLSVATTTSTTVTIAYTGTAIGGTDYTASSTTITIPAGSLTGTVTVTPIDDAVFEGNETVIADITNVTGGNGATENGTQTATVTIIDNETVPTVTLTGTTSVSENSGTSVTLTAALSVATTTATTVTITYTGTATSGTDYNASSATITIPAGSLTGSVTVTPIDDAIFEGSETVIADITNVTGGNGATENGTQTATVTITDDETVPTITLTGTTSVAENSSTAVTLTATLSVATTAATTVTLTYTGTATSGTDYNASSATITIPAGSLTGTLTVTPIDDAIFEGAETVIADITNVTGGNGATENGTQTATVTITDDETAPTLTLSGTTSVAENSGTAVTLTATLSVATTTATTVTIAYTGTATDGTDYTASSTTITIPAGSLTGTVTVTPTDDVVFEGAETVIADITNVTGGNGATENGTQTATVTITDNETVPTVTLTGTTTVTENSGTVVTLTATLSVATTTATTVTVAYTGTATSGADYTSSSTTITIPAGSLSGTVTVTPADDNSSEGSETVIVDITNVTGGNGATENGTQTETVTITDDEAVPSVTLSGTVSVLENAGTAQVITATLSGPASTPTVVTVTYTGTAANGADYTASSTIITIPAGATTGTLTVTPVDDLTYEGNETVIMDITNVTGGNGATENGTQTAIVTIIENDNSIPVANPNTASTNEDTPVAIPTVESNDTDVDGTVDANTIDLDPSTPGQQTTFTNAQGTWTVDAAGNVTYNPAADFNGTATVAYTINDNGGATSNVTTITVTVAPVNDGPVAVDNTTAIPEDGVATLSNILANDSDVDNALSFAMIDLDPATSGIQTTMTTPQGTWTLNTSTGDVTFVPASNFNGTATIPYEICDGGTPNLCATANLIVTVTPVNDAPVVDNDVNTIPEDGGPATGDVTDAGDFDPDGTPLVVTTTPMAGPSNGTVTINPDGTYAYTPNPNFSGTDVIQVEVCDQGTPLPGVCVIQTITITVTPVNDAPVAVDNSATVNEDNSAVLGTIQSNDTDVDGTVAASTIDLDPTSGGQQTTITTPEGTWTLNTSTGDVTFVPVLNFNGTATITYTINDNSGTTSNTAVLTVVVNPINDAPVITNEYISVGQNTPFNGDVTSAGDTDVEGTTLTTNTTPVVDPANGTIVVNANGTYTYTPNTGYTGTDMAVVSVCDSGLPLPAICMNDTIFITVFPTVPPVANNDNPVATNEDTPATFNVTGNDTDSDGSINNSTVDLDPGTAGIQTTFTNAQGTWTVDASGNVTFTPVADYNGTASVTYTVNDNIGATSNTATITIIVNPVNDAPVVDNDINTIPEDGGPATGDLTNTGDFDVDGTTLVVTTTPISGPSNGTIVINPDGTYTYTPNPNFFGTDVITVQICDQGTPLPAECMTQTLTITVTPVQDAPSNGNENVITEMNQSLANIDVTANNSDPDNDDLTVTAATNSTNGGSVTVNTDGTITYTPPVGFVGMDTIIYTVCDTAVVPNCVQDTLFVNVQPLLDTDGDGIPNITDLDDDNDGILDTIESANATNGGDTDGDGIPDGLDLDADNDGLTDVFEAGGLDSDGDGIIGSGPITDTDGDGVSDIVDPTNGGTPLTTPDTDGDGHPDYVDLDSDNDGIPDVVESGNTDTNGDGHLDSFNDSDNDGMDDNEMVDNRVDTDGDGVIDVHDLDSDNDGIPDVVEGGNTDNNGDGMLDNFNDNNGDGLDDDDSVSDPIDTDGDGVEDYVDLDSDNDGIPDVVEGGNTDNNGDGMLDNFNDNNGDGLDDDDSVSDPVDTDNDGNPDYTDTDSDNDGVPDSDENDPNGNGNGPDDSDGDGVPDYQDGDDDNDGIPTEDENGNVGGVYNDCDNDGTPDYLDVESCTTVVVEGLVIPEAFSPNGDGTNETFVLEGIGNFPGNTLLIFNRWGYEVFSATDYDNKWNGTSTGKMNVDGDQLPTGTYYYILDTKTEEYGVLKGYVYLKR